MKYAALILILLAGTANAVTFKCQAGPYWTVGDKIVVIATINDDGETGTINDDGETGTIKVAGVTHETQYKVDGFDRRWNFGEGTGAGLWDYAFVLRPDGTAQYYDFTSVAAGESVSSRQTFFCK